RARPLIALLPGSRKQEVLRVLPVMSEVIMRFPELQFAVATVNNLDPAMYDPVMAYPNVTLVEEDTYNLLLNAQAAIVTSGTATLETALFKVPQMVVYKAAGLTIALGKLVIKVKYISLVNLIAGRQVVRELIQEEANAETISEELRALVAEGGYRKEMLSGYDEIIRKLDTGSASENAGRLMVEYLKAGISNGSGALEQVPDRDVVR